MPKSIGSRREILCTSCLEDVSIVVQEMSFCVIADSGALRETWLPRSTVILYSSGEKTDSARTQPVHEGYCDWSAQHDTTQTDTTATH